MNELLAPVVDPTHAVAMVTPRYVGDADGQRAAAAVVMSPFETVPTPDGFSSVAIYASTDGEHLLAYATWSTLERFAAFRLGAGSALPAELAEPIPFSLYRSREFADVGPARLLVPPTFDVDGPERQRKVADTLLDGALSRPFPGLVGCHFHLSLDGTRVLNWAEWTDEDAHEAFMKSTVPQECFDSITMPGVRGIGGKRYVLTNHLTATEVPA